MNDIIGWIMAWLPEGEKYYHFEFFQGIYDYWPISEETCHKNLTALERAEMEIKLLKDGKIKKNGFEVTDTYLIPIFGKVVA